MNEAYAAYLERRYGKAIAQRYMRVQQSRSPSRGYGLSKAQLLERNTAILQSVIEQFIREGKPLAQKNICEVAGLSDDTLRAREDLMKMIAANRETSILISVRNVVRQLESKAPKNYTIRAIARLAHCSEPGIYRNLAALNECRTFLERNQKRIVELLNQGLTASEVVQLTGVSHPTLRKWRKECGTFHRSV